MIRKIYRGYRLPLAFCIYTRIHLRLVLSLANICTTLYLKLPWEVIKSGQSIHLFSICRCVSIFRYIGISGDYFISRALPRGTLSNVRNRPVWVILYHIVSKLTVHSAKSVLPYVESGAIYKARFPPNHRAISPCSCAMPGAVCTCINTIQSYCSSLLSMM